MSGKDSYLKVGKIIENLAFQTAKIYNLKLNGFRLNELIAFNGVWGLCYYTERVIEMRLMGVRTNKLLPKYRILNTLAHELAHLEEFKHNKAHKKLTNSINEYLKRQFK